MKIVNPVVEPNDSGGYSIKGTIFGVGPSGLIGSIEIPFDSEETALCVCKRFVEHPELNPESGS